jgi:hypothetical protein
VSVLRNHSVKSFKTRQLSRVIRLRHGSWILYHQDTQSHISTCCDSFSATVPSLTPPPPSEGKGSVCGNAFSVLMSSHKENNAWKEAEAVEDRSFRPTKANGGRRKAPFYKVLQGMPIAVDAFRYGEIPGVTSYFLTCAHPNYKYA